MLQLISGPVCARLLCAVFLSFVTVLNSVASSAFLLRKWRLLGLSASTEGGAASARGRATFPKASHPTRTLIYGLTCTSENPAVAVMD